MKKKYFVRGLGVGIIFGALIMLAAYLTSGGNRISDEEVIKRAEKLGMVKESEYVIHTDDTTEEITTEKTTEKQTTTAVTTTEVTTEEQTTAEATTEQTTEATTTEKQTTEPQNKDTDTKATITISGGMSSETISSLLEDADLVDSASDFNRYLVENGYDMKLETGSFEITGDMTYEEIAKILTQKQ